MIVTDLPFFAALDASPPTRPRRPRIDPDLRPAWGIMLAICLGILMWAVTVGIIKLCRVLL
jgi:hypothetical protein